MLRRHELEARKPIPARAQVENALLGVTLSHFTLVRGECRQDLLLLLVWHLEKVKSSAKFGSDLIELGGRDLQFAMRLVQAERSFARFRSGILLRGHPQRCRPTGCA